MPPTRASSTGASPSSDRRIAVPFGRLVPPGDTDDPAHEYLVGREGLHRYVVDRLESRRNHGAYLVTGHRGVGKTSFVRACLETYRGDVVGRFLRSNIGRSLFWDYALIVGLCVAVVLLLLLTSEIATLLAVSWTETSSAVRAMLLVPTMIICGYPLIYAVEVLRSVLGSRGYTKGADGWYAGLITVTVAAVGLFVPAMARPAESAAMLMLQVAWLAVAAEVIHAARSFQLIKPGIWAAGVGAASWIAYGNVLLETGESTATFVRLHLGHAASLAAAYLWLIWHRSGGHAIRLTPTLALPRAQGATRFGERAAYAWYLLLSIVVFALAWQLYPRGLSDWIIHWCAVPLTTSAFIVQAEILHRGFALRVLAYRPAYDAPAKEILDRPRVLLIAKSVLLILLSLHLLLPGLHFAYAEGSEALAILTDQDTSARPVIERAAEPVSDSMSSRTTLAYLATTGEGFASHMQGSEDDWWMIVVALSVLALFFLEYEWVIKRYMSLRERTAFHATDFYAGPTGGLPNGASASRDAMPDVRDPVESLRQLAEHTFAWRLMSVWKPLLTVEVNLGIERLTHGDVLQSMLLGLRNAYERQFLRPHSFVRALWRVVLVLTVAFAATLVGDALFSRAAGWFDRASEGLGVLQTADKSGWCGRLDAEAETRRSDPEATRGAESTREAVPTWLCQIAGADRVLASLLAPVFELPPIEHKEFVRHFLPRQVDPPSSVDGEQAQAPPIIRFRGYHVLFLLLFGFVAWRVDRRVAPAPYRKHRDEIERLHQRLVSATTVQEGRSAPTLKVGTYAVELPGVTRTAQAHEDPADPRSIEREFIELLERIQESEIRLPGGEGQLISLPSPEVVFLFDELDKVGLDFDADRSRGAGEGAHGRPTVAERERAARLHALLGELKNLLSRGPARFFFVGGENLFAEWLADETHRRPLLTSIFDVQVHVPSLLTDVSRRANIDGDCVLEPPTPRSGRGAAGVSEAWSRRVMHVVFLVHRRAELLFDAWHRRRMVPPFGLWVDRRRPPQLASEADTVHVTQDYFERGQPKMFVIGEGGAQIEISDFERHVLQRDFYQFLTYRSRGLPKRLLTLVYRLSRPTRAFVEDTRVKIETWDCTHALLFEQRDRFRFQLVADVYRQLVRAFGRRLDQRDDRMTVSLFYLADYVLKFHRRAFTWHHLGQADEALHIHRALDVQGALMRLVYSWSEQFLHPILNGLYDYRFRSDFAREIAYLSRIDEMESATLNFTLDESQAIKADYERILARMGDHPTADVLAALGDLHEFDEEFEMARYYYLRAVSIVDVEFNEMFRDAVHLEEGVGPPAVTTEKHTVNVECAGDASSSVPLVLLNHPWGRERARKHVTWGIARLRLMLQIGMTYERTHNYERALGAYRDARTLANALTRAFVRHSELAADPMLNVLKRRRGGGETDRIEALKHLNLLFQPIFAEAWVQEKLPGGVDTSVASVERELLYVRNLLPFPTDRYGLDGQFASRADGPDEVAHSNVALTLAELHNKAGDLFFFKGRYPAIDEGDPTDLGVRQSGLALGYLMRAHHHYSLGLLELRRFNRYRSLSSEQKFQSEAPHREGQWPDFVHRAAGGALNDLAEATLGRVALSTLYNELRGVQSFATTWSSVEAMRAGLRRDARQIRRWLSGVDVGNAPLEFVDGTAAEWIEAAPNGPSHQQLHRLRDMGVHTQLQRLLFGIDASYAGADVLARGGYGDDAATELIQIAELAGWLLRATRSCTWLSPRLDSIREGGHVVGGAEQSRHDAGERLFEAGVRAERSGLTAFLATVAAVALYDADRLLRRARAEMVSYDRTSPYYLLGETIPVDALRAAAAVMVATRPCPECDAARQVLVELVEHWAQDADGASLYCANGDHEALWLRHLRDTHAFPMRNRLRVTALEIERIAFATDPEDSTQALRREMSALLRAFILDADRFESPMHVTPAEQGLAMAIGWSWLKLALLKHEPDYVFGLEELRYETCQVLLSSIGMCTMRRGYYESIAELYYLYDDFNDRRIHFNHAIQMMVLDLTSALFDTLSEGNDRRPGTPRHPTWPQPRT